MALAARGGGGGRGSGVFSGVGGGGIGNGFFSFRIFVSAMFSLLFLAAISVVFSSHHYASSADPDLPMTGNAYVQRTFLTLKSDPLKMRIDLIHKQANDHVLLVNAYAAYARKLKLENTRQLRLFDDLAQNLTNLVAKPAYRDVLFQTDGPVDEEVLRQFEKEVKDKVKTARLMITEAKECYDNQLKIQKLKDTVFAAHELLVKTKKNGAYASLIAAKSVPRSPHCLVMRLVEERISHPEKYLEEERKPEFEDPSLYHYAIL